MIDKYNMGKKLYTIKTKEGLFRVKIWRDNDDKAYLVKGISLPEVVTFGKDLKEAKKMAKDALELYCDCVIGENKIIIDDSQRAIGKIPKSRIVEINK